METPQAIDHVPPQAVPGAPAPDEERQQIRPERRPGRRLRGQRWDLRVQGPHLQEVRWSEARLLLQAHEGRVPETGGGGFEGGEVDSK